MSSVVGRARIVADVKVAVNRADQGVDKHLADRARRWQRAGGHASGVRQELAAGVVQWTPKTEVEATSILPSLNGKTARSWRGIVPFTHLAREGRMTVTIGRRELLAALGGAAAAWLLAA